MTATQQQGNPFSRFTKTVISAVRHLNGELTGAGEAMARTNRFPQPRPQADPAQVKDVQPVSTSKVLTGV